MHVFAGRGQRSAFLPNEIVISDEFYLLLREQVRVCTEHMPSFEVLAALVRRMHVFAGRGQRSAFLPNEIVISDEFYLLLREQVRVCTEHMPSFEVLAALVRRMHVFAGRGQRSAFLPNEIVISDEFYLLLREQVRARTEHMPSFEERAKRATRDWKRRAEHLLQNSVF